ncbi:MAG: phosphatidylserine decarboxylase [Acidobacteria bacterium 13_1_40CM_2_64_6]|nr:MAG: phosphatidylserine decarboxylase [Acidobacteria bacterium 13_1_40CM_65_14]OLC79912.1 MAG: phosphatidylserine decarboxylase [Acidobacteria bacterium 13_1_40CM_4_65_8]OLD19928.1 MAG: phosphatidylserine decarboxylase [Acidobacteria bacterium 13_1_40CM_3_65_5]OLD55865.1 MAG: phosphatidylserine decarboxylase [Acidobacteria bacterium 13_1_40CM_2_64_6]
MRFDPAGLPFIGGALLLAFVAGAAVAWFLAIPFVALGAFFAFFFRDPERVPPTEVHAVLAPADGRVIHAGPALKESAPPGEWQQISIFLSPVDVHVNRIPVSGRVTSVSYIPGRFLPAYRHDAGSANERSEIWIDHDGQTVVVRQVVGILARRVVCRVEKGADVRSGERFGIMKFGSRMDVFVPMTATMTVKVGDIVRAGETVIALLH